MLTTFLDWNVLKDVITTKPGIPSLPSIGQREVWERADPEHKQFFVKEAEAFLGYQWPVLTATDYMDFYRTGNRALYNVFSRRRALGYLTLAECMENKGRFLDDIVNCIWMICEESTWVPPAHNHQDVSSPALTTMPLPDLKAPSIDLFASETGALLSCVYQMLKEKLDEMTPLLSARMEDEVRKRILEVYLDRDDFWWMGINKTRKLNNWTTWCTSNCLVAFLIFEKDHVVKVKAVAKAIASMEAFMEHYHQDGGCDEGPNYWSQAGGALFECLELLYMASDGAINVYKEQLIKNIGSYIYKAHISESYYANFADSSPTVNVMPDLLFRFGLQVEDKNLIRQAIAENARTKGKIFVHSWFPMLKILNAVFTRQKIDQYAPEPYPYLRDAWLPDLQVMTAREFEGSDKGLYVAAKGGHNAESHNHNDVGNFIVYQDGKPVIIDIGVGVYSRKTFGPDRYDIWTMQSRYHNLPVINGVMQQHGGAFKAANVSYGMNEEQASMVMDIASAYPEQSGVQMCMRTVRLARGNDRYVEVNDRIRFRQPEHEVSFSFMTNCRCEVLEETIRLNGDLGQQMCIQYDNRRLIVEIEEIKLDDDNLQNNWGSSVYRMVFTSTKPEVEHEFKFKFSEA